MRVCECCGHPLPEYEAIMNLTATQQRLFRIVHRAGKAGIGAETIMTRLYAHDPHGGAAHRSILSVLKHSMQPRLQKHGLKLVCRRGPGALWTLEKI